MTHQTTWKGAKWLLILKFAQETGYTPKAVEQKINSGKWPYGKIWRNSPDGRRQINMVEYEKWVESD
ncbi:hypothetical protein [Endozoicomonas sp. Mp262]|uniref:hypothetical protein n=1 Tax=Endozoicomonas sp. Mp262 TaxID=2919499 RepID=UPI0021DAAFB7